MAVINKANIPKQPKNEYQHGNDAHRCQDRRGDSGDALDAPKKQPEDEQDDNDMD